jgi:hypothetical protein
VGSKYHKNNKSLKLKLFKKSILIREKKLISTHFDFLECKINKGILTVKGICKPTTQSPVYKYTLTYNAVNPPKVLVINPIIKYNDEIHMYPSDNSLCLYHSKTDDLLWNPRKHNIFDTIIPWTQEWFTYYELYNITGAWEHPYIDHRLNKNIE